MNSALSRNSLKVLSYICCKHWEMPLVSFQFLWKPASPLTFR